MANDERETQYGENNKNNNKTIYCVFLTILTVVIVLNKIFSLQEYVHVDIFAKRYRF